MTMRKENARDWLILKIAECLSSPMSEETAAALCTYAGAYNALERWKGGNGNPGKIHWTMEQTDQILHQRKLKFGKTDFFLAMNEVYGVYSKVAEAHGLNNPGFFAEMAEALLVSKGKNNA